MLYKLDVSSIGVLGSSIAGTLLDLVPALGYSFMRSSFLEFHFKSNQPQNPSSNPSPF